MDPRTHLTVFDGYQVHGVDAAVDCRALEAELDAVGLELFFPDPGYTPDMAYVVVDRHCQDSARGGLWWADESVSEIDRAVPPVVRKRPAAASVVERYGLALEWTLVRVSAASVV